MNFFERIPDNFFSLLSSPNKAIYAGCIIEAYKIYEDASIMGIEKKIIVEVLTDYLEKDFFDETKEHIEVEEGKSVTPRDKAYYILSRMQECGWIDIDITNDYVELLNFTDPAITITEALIQLEPKEVFTYDTGEENSHYRGLIYTIYTLLTSKGNLDYGLIVSEVYRNTKMLIRELRRIDSHLKEYLKMILDRSDIKELMELLMAYKTELVDRSYVRLKTSDNVNKYRLEIVNRLEDIQNDPIIFSAVVEHYILRYHDLDEATRRANRDINEIIDVFNEFDQMILEIDQKNKTYLNTTIGKIEFLLKEDSNITGKLNTILKYVSDMKKKSESKYEQAIRLVNQAFRLKSFKLLENSSLYQPRNPYQKRVADRLLPDRLDILDLQSEFFKQYENSFSEEMVLGFLDSHLIDNKTYASALLKDDPEIDDLILVIYALIYAVSDIENKYVVTQTDIDVEKGNFYFKDFIIAKVGDE